MGVRLVLGKADGTQDAAVMYDSVTGYPVGAIWEGVDAHEQAEAFLEWVSSGKWMRHHQQIFGGMPTQPVQDVMPDIYTRNDVRAFTPDDLAELRKYWRAIFVGDDGYLIDTKECVCGAGHHHDNEGCLQCDCVTFVPTHEAGRVEASYA